MPCVCNALVLHYAKGGEIMSENNIYKQMYYKLFNSVSDAIDALAKADFSLAQNILIEAQQNTEEIYISQE